MGLTKAKAGDMESAVEDLAESSDLGHAGAQYNMGLCFELGQGVNASIAQVCVIGHAGAQYNMGLCFELGQGVNTSIAQVSVITLFKKIYLSSVFNVPVCNCFSQ